MKEAGYVAERGWSTRKQFVPAAGQAEILKKKKNTNSSQINHMGGKGCGQYQRRCDRVIGVTNEVGK